MSAICGILRFDRLDVRSTELARQINTLSRRGPDGLKSWRDGPIGLGHALMRVTEEDAYEAQPLQDLSGRLALVADMRLDNREELAKVLGADSAALGTMPDSALLMLAYKKWGEDCAEHLVGDFVFAIWDGCTQKLLLGRDHMGQRHFFFYRTDNFFVFASEKKGLWAVEDVPQVLEEAFIGKILIGDPIPGDGLTQFKAVFGLPGGTTMSVGANGSVTKRRYWEVRAGTEHLDRDEEYYVEAYRRVLAEAVACRLRRATRPAALFLSGGFDSAAVAGLAGPVLAPRQRKLIAVSSVMPQDYRGPLPQARKWTEICRRFMPHLDVHYVTREGFGLFDRLEEDFNSRDGSSSANRAANRAIYAAMTANGAQVVMDGHGGDYTLNPKARGWLGDLLKQGRLRTFIRELRAYRHTHERPFWRVVRAEVVMPLFSDRLQRTLNLMRRGVKPFAPVLPIDPGFAAQMRAQGETGTIRISQSAPPGRRAKMWTMLARMQDAAISPGYVAGAQYGLEHTMPFHDKRVVELALAIPPSLYVRGGRNRYLARRALKDIYPPEFQTRYSVNDDPTPDFEDLLARQLPIALGEIARMEQDAKLRRYFDFAKMRKMLSHKARRDDGFNPEPRMATTALILARFVEWTQRGNA